ncbi:MAG: hypothetical protein ACI8PZ_005318 [Myxococcota bacterium]|jgi:hypothetical protein
MWCLTVLWLVACASPVAAAPPVAPTPPARVEGTPAPPPPAPTVRLGTVSHSLDRPVVSLVLGRPRVAALVDEDGALTPWWLNDTWEPLPLPQSLRVTDADLRTARIHFGRNDMAGGLRGGGAEARARGLWRRARGVDQRR